MRKKKPPVLAGKISIKQRLKFKQTFFAQRDFIGARFCKNKIHNTRELFETKPYSTRLNDEILPVTSKELL